MAPLPPRRGRARFSGKRRKVYRGLLQAEGLVVHSRGQASDHQGASAAHGTGPVFTGDPGGVTVASLSRESVLSPEKRARPPPPRPHSDPPSSVILGRPASSRAVLFCAKITPRSASRTSSARPSTNPTIRPPRHHVGLGVQHDDRWRILRLQPRPDIRKITVRIDLRRQLRRIHPRRRLRQHRRPAPRRYQQRRLEPPRHQRRQMRRKPILKIHPVPLALLQNDPRRFHRVLRVRPPPHWPPVATSNTPAGSPPIPPIPTTIAVAPLRRAPPRRSRIPIKRLARSITHAHILPTASQRGMDFLTS